MKKFLLSIILLFPLCITDIKSETHQEQIYNLSHKIESIEHELSYLKLTYELCTLINELNNLRLEVLISINDIQNDYYNRGYDKKMKNTYFKTYDSYKQRVKSMPELISLKKEYFNLMMLSKSFTTSEQELLHGYYNGIDLHFNALNDTIESMKTVLNILYNP